MLKAGLPIQALSISVLDIHLFQILRARFSVQITYGIHTSFGHVNIFHYFMESAEYSELAAVLTLWERVAFLE